METPKPIFREGFEFVGKFENKEQSDKLMRILKSHTKLVKALEDLVKVLPDPRDARVFEAKQAAIKALEEAKP